MLWFLRAVAAIVLTALSFTAVYADPPAREAKAAKLIARTDYYGALKALDGAEGAEADFLRGQAYFQLGEFKKAATALEAAVAGRPNDSNVHLWLGRAMGRRAETANPFQAPGLASKARQSFERAVELNPANGEALGDLFEYYLEAPGFLGGGLDKAKRIAERIRPLDEAEYHFALAQIALKSKQYPAAEQQLRAAVDAAPKQVGRLLDLAKFLVKSGRIQEAEATYARAEQVAPNSAKVKYRQAEAYVSSGKNLDKAKVLLKEYLQSTNLTAEDPSRADAERLLKRASGG
jgi:tetratricopeptide (TPR) repeat protein